MLETLQSKGSYVIIVSDSVEIALFGVYTVLFACALLLLVVFKRPLPVDWSMVAATSVLYMVCITHVVFATTDKHTTLSGDFPIPSASDLSGILRVGDISFKICCFMSQLMMIHRCWAVWDFRLPVVALPLVMSLSAIVLGIINPIRLPTSRFTSPFAIPRDLAFDVPSAVLSLLIYVLVTSLITLRLRRVSSMFRHFKSMESVILSLLGACIEAGALLVFIQIFVVVFLTLDHPAILLIEGIAAQLYGIAPTIMIIRLALSLIPRSRLRQYDTTTAPQFSTLLIETIYPQNDYTDDIELDDITPVDRHTVVLPTIHRRSPEHAYER